MLGCFSRPQRSGATSASETRLDYFAHHVAFQTVFQHQCSFSVFAEQGRSVTPAEQDAAEGITKREFELQTFHAMF